MKRLLIEPLDVLMFRSERPFTAREVRVARTGVIYPLTFEGAIKSKIFSEFCRKKGYSPKDFQRIRKRNESLNDFERTNEELIEFVKLQMEKDEKLKELLEVMGYTPLEFPSKLNVLGVFFAKKDKKDEFAEYFPIPNDVVREDKENGKIVKLQPKESFQFKWVDKSICACITGYSQVKNIEGLMSFHDLINYLNGNCPKPVRIKYRDRDLKKPYFKEIRSGIELEKDRKKTVEGALYTAEFIRLIENWGFIVWYEAPDVVSIKGALKLGGEGKGAISQPIEDKKIDWAELIEKINEDKKFKLYLATPSYFNGCIPPKNVLEKILGVNLKLVSALPGKPVYIGGYNFALNKEKSLRRWVNAGAVYHYKFKGEIKEDISLPIKIIDKDKNIDMRCAFIGRW